MRLMLANDGVEALERLAERQVDIILLDLHMPRLSGDALLRKLKQNDDFKDIPVVIVSADATPSRIKELKSCGAAEYLTKPIDVRLLMQVMQDLLIPTH